MTGGADPVTIALWVLGGLVALHVLVVVIGAIAIMWPNPFQLLRSSRHPEQFGLKAQRMRLRDGSAAWFIPHPDARPVVVVCHGRSRDKGWMLPLVERLAVDAHVLVFDFPAHGDNPWARTSLGLREADTVDAALDWCIASGFDDLIVVGTSMGGAAAIRALGQQPRPQVRGLVTDGTFDALTTVFDNVAGYVAAPRYLVNLVQTVGGRAAGFDVTEVRPIDQAPGLAMPAVFLHGDRDPLVPTACCERLAAAAPMGTCHVYPGGHDQPSNPAMQAALLAAIASFERRAAVAVA